MTNEISPAEHQQNRLLRNVLFAFQSTGNLISVLLAAFTMTGIARGGNSNFSNTMVSTLPGDKATRGYNLLHGCFAVGALLSPLVLVFCTNRFPNMGWRNETAKSGKFLF